LDPGSPTPQAGILNQSMQNCTKIHRFCKLDDDPEKVNNEPLIIKTLLQVHNEGKTKKTIECFASHLKYINQNADINNPESAKTYISNLNRDPQTKNSYAIAYNWYCKTNGIQWKKPYFKWERKIPMIPTTQNIDKIISASSQKYSTIFTILKEHGLEAHELATVQRNDIDQERGIINVRGCKGHNSRTIKLSTKTADMLRIYLQRYRDNNPFPNSHVMGEEWRATRKKVARNLNQPELAKIPMRNLRHHFASHTYDQTKDILLVKQLLGHKKLETTMFYTQLITFDQDDEYNCKATTDNKEAQDLIEHGFQYILTTPNGLMMFRKRK
jgi:site-specific recombinase XerD